MAEFFLALLLSVPAQAQELRCVLDTDLAGKPIAYDGVVKWNSETANLGVVTKILGGENVLEVVGDHDLGITFRLYREKCERTTTDINSPDQGRVSRSEQFFCDLGSIIPQSVLLLTQYDFLEKKGLFREFVTGEPVRGFHFSDCL